MRNIVVGVDGSEPSLRALLLGASLTEDLREAQLVVAHARYVPYLWSPKHVAEAEFSDFLDDAEQYIRDTVQAELRAFDLEWTIEVREGEPSQVLREIARDVDASFLIVGRRGWSMAEELLLGSVSNRLVHRAETPVLLVR